MVLLRQETLLGTAYGPSTFKVYDACLEGQERQDPLLVVWLHGADMGDIPAQDLAVMHKRLRRHCVFLVPLSPKAASDGLRFSWGLGYTKAQNKGGLGFVYGTQHEAFLRDLASAIMELKEEVHAAGVYSMGYSMGGFGVYQLASFMPALFDAAVAVAGYGQGTLDTSGGSYSAPQPEASRIFDDWCDRNCPKLAKVGALVVIHSPADRESSYTDAREIVSRVKREGGCAKLVTVPADLAESDRGSKKTAHPSGHRYFNYAFLNESSVDVLYDRITALLASSALEPASPPRTTSCAGAARVSDHGEPSIVRKARRRMADAVEGTRALEQRPPGEGPKIARELPQSTKSAWIQKPVDAFRAATKWRGGSLEEVPQPSQIPASRLEAIEKAAARFRDESKAFV